MQDNYIEQTIKDSFTKIKAPKEIILRGAYEKASAPSRFLFKKRALILAVVLISLMAVTAAAAQYFDSFYRLRNIIGDERADLLTPISALHDPTDGTYDTIISHGIRVELVAIGVYGNIADVFITLEDTIGNRLDGDDILIRYFILPADRQPELWGSNISPNPMRVIHRCNGVVTLHGRQFFARPVSGDVVFHLEYIVVSTAQCTEPLPIYLVDFLGETEAMPLLNHIEMTISTVCESTVNLWQIKHDFRKAIDAGEMYVLRPHTLNMGSELEGADMLISAMGVVDGRFHIQLYFPTPLCGAAHDINSTHWGGVTLLRGDERLNDVTLRFDINENGEIYHRRAHIGLGGISCASNYTEIILT